MLFCWPTFYELAASPSRWRVKTNLSPVYQDLSRHVRDTCVRDVTVLLYQADRQCLLTLQVRRLSSQGPHRDEWGARSELKIPEPYAQFYIFSTSQPSVAVWGRRYVLADWHPNRWRTSRKYSRFITYPCRMGQTLQINCFGLGQLLNNLRHNCLLTLKINPYTAKARPHSRF